MLVRQSFWILAPLAAFLLVATPLLRADGPCGPSTRPAGGCGESSRRSRTPLEPPCGDTQPTRVQLALLELACASGVAAVDLDHLAAGHATLPVVLDRLQQFGQAAITFRADSVIDLKEGTEITQGCRMPVVQEIRVDPGGAVTPSVSYDKVGTVLKVRGYWRDDDPQQADVVCEVKASSVSESLVRVSSGVTLPAFGEIQVRQTLPARHGRPICSLLAAGTQSHEGQSLTSLTFLYLVLTREGEPLPPPVAAAAAPQTMVQAVILEVAGKPEELARIDLGQKPPTDLAGLHESLGRYGQVREVARPSVLALWPATSTVTTAWMQPVTVEPGPSPAPRPPGPQPVPAPQPAPAPPGRYTVHQRVQCDFTIVGNWSREDPRRGRVAVDVVGKGMTIGPGAAQTGELAVRALHAEADIRDGQPVCLLGDTLGPQGPDTQARRYAVLLTARRTGGPGSPTPP